MKILQKFLIAAAAFAIATAGAASAATLKLTSTFDVVKLPNSLNLPPALGDRFQPDTGGLDGSRFKVDIVFADGTTITNGFAAAESVTVNVSGASVESSNGSFVVSDPVGLFAQGGLGKPTSFLGNPPGSGTFAIGSIIAKARFDSLGTFSSPGEGNELTLASLDGVTFTFAGTSDNSQLTNARQRQFDARNIMTSATVVGGVAPVPLPATLPLLLAGLGGLGGISALRRRKIS